MVLLSSFVIQSMHWSIMLTPQDLGHRKFQTRLDTVVSRLLSFVPKGSPHHFPCNVRVNQHCRACRQNIDLVMKAYNKFNIFLLFERFFLVNYILLNVLEIIIICIQYWHSQSLYCTLVLILPRFSNFIRMVKTKQNCIWFSK